MRSIAKDDTEHKLVEVVTREDTMKLPTAEEYRNRYYRALEKAGFADSHNEILDATFSDCQSQTLEVAAIKIGNLTESDLMLSKFEPNWAAFCAAEIRALKPKEE